LGSRDPAALIATPLPSIPVYGPSIAAIGGTMATVAIVWIVSLRLSLSVTVMVTV
jgi:hypothetical protein